MYTKERFIADSLALFDGFEGISVDIPGIGETVLYDSPLIGFASADDEIFETYRRPEVIGENYLAPHEWLPGAKTVISFFLPASEAVRSSNAALKMVPSYEWLYARIEGQAMIARFIAAVRDMLKENGIDSCVPLLDERFNVQIEMTGTEENPDFHADSRWSERHAAYACGLGSFGLSRGLITERGMAGRYVSIIIAESFEPDERRYPVMNEYCKVCGACIEKCPVKAISQEYSKNNVKCNKYVSAMGVKYDPRYGCGKCQVGVPCEFSMPGIE